MLYLSVSNTLSHSTAILLSNYFRKLFVLPLPANQRKLLAFARDSLDVKHGCHYHTSIPHIGVYTTNVQMRITTNGMKCAAFNPSRTTSYLYMPKVRSKYIDVSTFNVMFSAH